MLLFAFTVAGPLILQHRLVVACLVCVRTIIHLLFATLVTVGIYGLVLLTMVDIYPNGQPLADVLYGFGFALATMLAVCGGTMAAPRRLARRSTPAASGLAAMFPVWLYLHNGLGGDGRAVFLWYLAGSLAGSIMAMRLLARASAPHWTPLGARIA